MSVRKERKGRTGRRRDHLVDRGHDHLEEDNELGVVLWSDAKPTNFGETLEGDVSELRNLEELVRRRRRR